MSGKEKNMENYNMFIPQLEIIPIDPELNVRFICKYLSPEMQANKTRPFLEKTLLMYPELTEALTIQDDNIRNTIIREAVLKHLEDAKEEIETRINYFSEKFNSFIYDFIVAQCNI